MRFFATPPQTGADPKPVAVPQAPLVPLEVLVAEDDPVHREGLRRAITQLGHSCRVAADGLEAWAMHQSQPADVILSDWHMPRLDGVELCRRTRVAKDAAPYTYFILMTSFADKEHFLLGMEAGADDYHTKPVDLDELRARLVSAGRVVSLYRKLARQNAALRRDSQASFRVARLDALTEVPNRRSMDEDLRVLWARAQRYRHPHSLAICDIDWFKIFNDRHGHLLGDDALRKVARALRHGLRVGDGLYRYGGEEFLVVLPEQPLVEAVRAVERLREAVEALAIPASDRTVLTVSFGVAEADMQRDTSCEDWLRRADAALYRAKESGRNRSVADSTSG